MKLPEETRLRHFNPSEFQGWWQQINCELLYRLDELRSRSGGWIDISPAAGAVGRNWGSENTSQHNVDRWGMVNAVDFFAQNFHCEYAGKDEIAGFVELMREVGFTGIGVYMDTYYGVNAVNEPIPFIMFHGDVRKDRALGDPAMWSRINGEYRDIDEAL